MLTRRKSAKRQVGWVVGDQLEYSPWFQQRDFKAGGSGLVRFEWVRDYVNNRLDTDLTYSLYRPWKRFDAVIFQKSMGRRSVDLLRAMKLKGGKTVFDSNVNYYQDWGEEYYKGMRPTNEQMQQAKAMTQEADAVIADSPHLFGICRQMNDRVAWLPDNVDMNLVPAYLQSDLRRRPLPVFWSGQALKLFELLAIESVLREYRKSFTLFLVTNSLSALDRWRPDVKRRFEALLCTLDYTIIPFESVEQLFRVYARGGIFISPRFLDNAYNMGHTEWKVALAMACGRISFCSPVPSYVELARRAEYAGIRVCETNEQWFEAFESVLSCCANIEMEETSARTTIENHYSTEIIAERHAAFVGELLSD